MTINSLSKDNFYVIFSNLDFQDVVVCERVSKAFKDLISNEDFWKFYAASRGIPAAPTTLSSKVWIFKLPSLKNAFPVTDSSQEEMALALYRGIAQVEPTEETLPNEYLESIRDNFEMRDDAILGEVTSFVTWGKVPDNCSESHYAGLGYARVALGGHLNGYFLCKKDETNNVVFLHFEYDYSTAL